MQTIRQIAEGRHPIIHQITIQQLTIFVNHLFHQRVTNAEHYGAFVLANALIGVDRLACVADRNIVEQVNDAGFGIYLEINATPAYSQNVAVEPKTAFLLRLSLYNPLAMISPA